MLTTIPYTYKHIMTPKGGIAMLASGLAGSTIARGIHKKLINKEYGKLMEHKSVSKDLFAALSTLGK